MKNFLKKANAVFCMLLAVAFMYAAYLQWSKYGDYTVTSFLMSLIIHGGLAALLERTINILITKI